MPLRPLHLKCSITSHQVIDSVRKFNAQQLHDFKPDSHIERLKRVRSIFEYSHDLVSIIPQDPVSQPHLIRQPIAHPRERRRHLQGPREGAGAPYGTALRHTHAWIEALRIALGLRRIWRAAMARRRPRRRVRAESRPSLIRVRVVRVAGRRFAAFATTRILHARRAGARVVRRLALLFTI